MNIRSTTAIALLGGAVMSCGASRVGATVTDAAWISSTQFVYRIEFVPDFDQRRNTLPANGSNYCVPTSFLNWGGYVARRGFPNQLPGSPPWNYTAISLNLFLLGAAMQTDPNGGTGPATATPAANTFFGGRAFVVVTTGNNSNGYPRRTIWRPRRSPRSSCRVGWYNESNFP